MTALRPLALGLVICALVVFLAWRRYAPETASPAALPSPRITAKPPGLPPGVDLEAATLETAHYVVRSTADRERTAHVARAVESLYAAYAEVFRDTWPDRPPPRLHLMLYRDRAQFKAHNRSSPWAEAFYLAPWCHAYYAADEANPDHWMVHEATHQLNAEVMHFTKVRWINEGLATYFGASRIRDGVLDPGSQDADAYPLWWLPRLPFSGDRARDVRAGRFIPLRDLVAGTGPAIDRNVNLYYVEFWSLTHFLLHGDGGRHAAGYKRLIAIGGGVREFEAALGPMASIEAAWYADLVAKAKSARGGGEDDGVVTVELPSGR